jgi:hypothetical protein
MKKYFLLIAFAGSLLTSCQKCKECEIKVEFLPTSSLTESDCQENLGMSCDDYFNMVYGQPAEEFCGDQLDAAEDYEDINEDYRVYWDCK